MSSLSCFTWCFVLIPFIAGHRSLRTSTRYRRYCWRLVLIPFIAGHRSLRSEAPTLGASVFRLNPLHSGASVASCCHAFTLHTTELRLNPLHSGASVASCCCCCCCAPVTLVLIPFIAGHRSLQLNKAFPSPLPSHVLIPFIAGHRSLHCSLNGVINWDTQS